MTEDVLAHYGTPRHSGRYPWGSGENPHQHTPRSWLDSVETMRKGGGGDSTPGLSEAEVAKALGMSTTELRAYKSIAKTEQRQELSAEAQKLASPDKQWSTRAISEKLGVSEGTVRNLLNPALQERNDTLASIAGMLRKNVDENGVIDVGVGVERHLNISKEKLATAVAMLKAEGYAENVVQIPQLGTNKKTLVKTLGPEGTTYRDIISDTGQIKNIKTIQDYSEDGGRHFRDGKKEAGDPVSISSKRLGINYKEDGGGNADGVIYLRPGVDDISLGNARYVQARIAVDGTHYIKGMAMYRDDLPKGIDIVFNTNKSRAELGSNKLEALKPMQDDKDLPFGSIVRPHHYIDKKGVEKKSVINIVNEEKNWDDWSRNLSSQMLSKQRPELAKGQLDLTFQNKKAQFDEIMSLTNPTVKRKLLEEFADSADSSAVHLKAAALPGQKTHVILPFSSIKENEVYAPNFKDGEKVVLIRYPHGGTFEIPELTVNNRGRNPKSAIGNAKAAIGINPKVAERLSGADFDGDTVLVIPNKSRGPQSVKTSSPLEALKGFDPRARYPKYDGMKIMSNTQTEMGKISNLITDMTIKGASHSELARAVKHSMVVIDAEKHKLNYRQSEKDQGIAQLRALYQEGPRGGASTLISRAKGDARVDRRKLRPASEGGPIDPVTGEKVYVYSGESYVKKTTNKRTGVVTETVVKKKDLSTRMAEAKDARTLVSSQGTVMENLYADHANKLKALANVARKSSLGIKDVPYEPSAKAAYRKEVASLDFKLNEALKNAPLERQAQLVGNAVVQAKLRDEPDMPAARLKKVKAQALEDARNSVFAKKARIDITDSEWAAIQAGAVSPKRLSDILINAKPERIKELALPRVNTVMNKTMLSRAKAMASSGYTQSEIAEALGVPTSTLSTALGRES